MQKADGVAGVRILVGRRAVGVCHVRMRKVQSGVGRIVLY